MSSQRPAAHAGVRTISSSEVKRHAPLAPQYGGVGLSGLGCAPRRVLNGLRTSAAGGEPGCARHLADQPPQPVLLLAEDDEPR
jgi:hypothetical protein